MRIAMLIDVFPRPSNTFILNQITGLIDRGHEVDIFGIILDKTGVMQPSVSEYQLLDRLKHIPIPESPGPRILKALALLSKPYAWHPATLSALNVFKHGKKTLNLGKLYTTLSFLKESPYDIVHCQFGGLGLTALPLLTQGALKAKLVTSFRGADITSRNPDIYYELFQEGHLFLPVSKLFQEKLEHAECPPNKIAVMHSGIDTQRFVFKARHKQENEATKLVFIGRLTEKKGLAYAIKAVAKVLEMGKAISLRVIGDGELRPEIEALIKQHALEEQVQLLGHQPQDEVIKELEEAHILIGPSVTAKNGDKEGIPNVVKEAMAMGLPVISTLHSGIPELVESGVSGFLAPERDVTALVKHINFLDDHPNLWPKLGQAGRKKIEAEFDIEKLNDTLVNLYEGIL